MNQVKKLAGQTAIYGLSSIVARLMNFLLVPLYTRSFEPTEYGVVTELYSYVAFFIVLLTFGMETAFFRFANKKEDPENVYKSASRPVFSVAIMFIAVAVLLSQPIANLIKYPENAEYIIYFGIVLGLDAISALPLARLRHLKKAKRFAFVNLFSITVNIGLNLFFIVYCKGVAKDGGNWLTDTFYNENIGVGYIFISNLISSGLKVVLLADGIFVSKGKFSKQYTRELFKYGSPLLFAGFAGIINETLDRILLKYMLISEVGEAEALAQVGIYGACYKVAMFIALFNQAFRYAAEPFFFAKAKDKDAKPTYALVMKYYFILTCLAFLTITMFQDIAMLFIGTEFRVGAHVVPVLLAANIFLGIYFNQSVWYKVTDKTWYGAYIAFVGAAITILVNVLLIPHYGYEASAWATLGCYSTMTILSLIWGRKHYPIPYDFRKIIMYGGLTVLMFFTLRFIEIDNQAIYYVIRFAMLFFFAGLVYFFEVKKRTRNAN